MSVTREELVSKIATKGGHSKAAVNAVLSDFLDTVGEELANGNKVTLTGYLTFESSARAERQGRNPNTGESITIPATTVVKVKPGTKLSAYVK